MRLLYFQPREYLTWSCRMLLVDIICAECTNYPLCSTCRFTWIGLIFLTTYAVKLPSSFWTLRGLIPTYRPPGQPPGLSASLKPLRYQYIIENACLNRVVCAFLRG